jgi:DNA-binding NtrC family response regulator
VLEADDIHLDVERVKPPQAGDAFLPAGMTMDQWEEEMIREAVKRSSGNKSQAARLLGLSRNALRYRLSKMGIEDDPEKETEGQGRDG